MAKKIKMTYSFKNTQTGDVYESDSWNYFSGYLRQAIEENEGNGNPLNLIINCERIESKANRGVRVEVYDTRTKTTESYDSVKATAESLGIKRTLLYHYINHRRGRFKGYIVKRKGRSQ